MRKVAAGTVLVALVALYAGAVSADPPPAPAGLSPSGGEDVRDPRPTFSWAPVSRDAAYTIWFGLSEAEGAGSAEEVPAGQAWFVPGEPLQENSHVFWRVRAVDAQGQAGPWSATADFWVGRDIVPPEPAGDFVAAARSGGADLSWAASPSAETVGYRLYVRPEGGTYANPRPLGPVTAARVESLANGLSYDFMLTAVDAAGNESVGVVASVKPGTLVTLRGQAYPTIQAAVDAAQPGDTVELGVATFLEGVDLKPGVSLHGSGPGLTVLDASGFPAGVTLEASDASPESRSTVSNLTIRGGAAGVWGGVANVRLENLVIARVNGPGVKTDGGVLEAARVTIANCQRDGIETGGSGRIVDALILKNGGAGVLVRESGNVTVSYSDFYENLLGGMVGAAAGPGLMSTSAQFENEAADDYRVLAGDPTVDAGAPDSPFALEPSPNGGRVNVGAFGNTIWATPTLAPAAGTAIGGGSGSGGSSSKSNSYCVVATASFGSAGQSSVAELREFRDRVLRPLPAGSGAVDTYERAAAPVAREVRKSEVLRALVRDMLR